MPDSHLRQESETPVWFQSSRLDYDALVLIMAREAVENRRLTLSLYFFSLAELAPMDLLHPIIPALFCFFGSFFIYLSIERFEMNRSRTLFFDRICSLHPSLSSPSFDSSRHSEYENRVAERIIRERSSWKRPTNPVD